MPTVAELERLDALLDRLIPLSDVRRGELIQATGWNTLVQALIELTRAVLAEDQPGTVPEHEHEGAVSLSWLDPKLRSLIERGPLEDPVSLKRLRETERRSLRFNDHASMLETDLRSVRQRLDDVITRDVKREAEVIQFDKQLSELPKTRDDLQSLQLTFGNVQASLEEALDLRDNLLVDGEPVDLAGVLDRLDAADALRERLVRSDGQLLDAAAFDIELKTLTNAFVSRDELGEILSTQQLQLSDEQLSTLREQISTDLQAELDARVDERLATFQKEITAQLDQRLANVDEQVAKAAANLEADLRAALLETLRPEIDAAIAAGLDPINTKIDALEASLNETRATLTADVNTLKEQNAALQTSVRALQGDVGTLQSDVGGLSEKLGALDARLTEVSTSIQTLDGRVAGVERGVIDLKGTIDAVSTKVDRLATDVQALRSALDRLAMQVDSLNKRVSTLESGTGPDDFEVIDGIGATRESRLYEAGITTYEALAAMSVDQLAKLISVSLDVAKSIIDQAARLAG